jgi:hypothetical protein
MNVETPNRRIADHADHPPVTDPPRPCNARTAAGTRCRRSARPETLRCHQHEDRPPAPPIDWTGNVPILAARRTHGREIDMLLVDCPYCGAEHTHGAGPAGSRFGSGDGHRVTHCGSAFHDTSRPGYILREVQE